jgi:hypothetical protein
MFIGFNLLGSAHYLQNSAKRSASALESTQLLHALAIPVHAIHHRPWDSAHHTCLLTHEQIYICALISVTGDSKIGAYRQNIMRRLWRMCKGLCMLTLTCLGRLAFSVLVFCLYLSSPYSKEKGSTL